MKTDLRGLNWEEAIATVESLDDEIATLKAANAKLEAALDWIEEQYFRERKAMSNCDVATGGEPWPTDTVTLLFFNQDLVASFVEAPTLLEAIEKARAEEGGR